MTMRTDCRPGRGPAATKTWMKTPIKAGTLRAAALAGALALAACGGGGGSPALAPGDDPRPPDRMPPPGATPSGVPAVSGLHFDYTLERGGERPISEDGSAALSCPAAGCAARDLRELSDADGAGMRGGFGTLTGATGGPPLTEAFSGVSVTVSDVSFTRYGFWGAYGWAAVETGAGALSAALDGQRWTGSFDTAHAWAAGEPAGSNPAGAGSAVWRGIAEAARTADFARLPGTAELRIADLSRPRVDADIDLDDGAGGVALRWTGMAPAAGGFAQDAAGTGRIEGRFHGPGHEEAWGVFDTGAYVGAFGARRQ